MLNQRKNYDQTTSAYSDGDVIDDLTITSPIRPGQDIINQREAETQQEFDTEAGRNLN